MGGFGSRLADAVSRRGPLCPGIDPHPELIRAWGLTVDADGLAKFCDVCVAAFAGFAVVKPQVAFFEAFGAQGFAVLERTIGALQAAGVLVLADAKRGDIGSTMAAYAEAWAGDSPLAADAVTASPYLGFGSLQPLLDTAAAHDRGVFVLAATSNPEGASVQRADAGAGPSPSRSSTPPLRPIANCQARSALSSARPCPTRRMSAHWVDRCLYRASARRADGLRRWVDLAGLIAGSCCPRCRAMCCGPDPRSPPCAPRLNASAMRWRIWRDRVRRRGMDLIRRWLCDGAVGPAPRRKPRRPRRTRREGRSR